MKKTIRTLVPFALILQFVTLGPLGQSGSYSDLALTKAAIDRGASDSESLKAAMSDLSRAAAALALYRTLLAEITQQSAELDTAIREGSPDAIQQLSKKLKLTVERAGRLEQYLKKQAQQMDKVKQEVVFDGGQPSTSYHQKVCE